MAKRNFLKEVFRELESSDDEFSFDSFNTDFDKESDNICSDCSDSDSDVVPVKRRIMYLDISSDSEGEENYENSCINAFTLWKNSIFNGI